MASRSLTCVASVVFSGFVAAAGVACSGDAPAAKPGSAGAGAEGDRAPVLVELFTSEGCSSCPPADAVLAELLGKESVDGARIVALAWHVDYWNDLGWADRFSSAAATSRQRTYAAAFGAGQVYTPQMIVDGRIEFVGSDRGKALDAIAAAARAAKPSVHLTARPSDAAHPDQLTFDVHASGLPPAAAKDTAEVLFVLTEDGLHSVVRRGENAGRTLDHAAVVRTAESIGELKGDSFDGRATTSLRGDWDRRKLRGVVLIQEKQSRRVLAVGAADAPS